MKLINTAIRQQGNIQEINQVVQGGYQSGTSINQNTNRTSDKPLLSLKDEKTKCDMVQYKMQ